MAGGEIIVRVEALLSGGRAAEAARLLSEAAGAGQTAALAHLASWRIAGNVVRRDLVKARRLLAAAGARGDSGSALLHASFLASGTGGEADWPGALAALRTLAPTVPQAAAQLRLIDSMDLGEDGFPKRRIAVRPLSTAPRAAVAENFLTAAECAWLRSAAEPELQPSVVVDPATGRMAPHPVRTSDAAMFGVHGEDVAVNAINRRIAAASGTRPAQGEPLQVLRYRPGGEYKPHLDALPAEANQRILTCLVYLSDDYEGGETHFPRTGLSFRGRTGDALLFQNAAADGRADPLSLHAGLPVTRGTKYLASRWIRSERFTYPPPRPLVDM
ncbi:MAG TPA: 2OG-Fe(II) oxygenase [Allosphingosinicella sp.]|nr:2OG-Fe(II) oxygenase [Allosphingosinicella sp.]